MRIAMVIGSTISTIKDPTVSKTKLLICQPTDETGKQQGEPYVAIDLVYAGTGDLVLTCHGSAARQSATTENTPTDAVIMAVIDHLELDGKLVFQKDL